MKECPVDDSLNKHKLTVNIISVSVNWKTTLRVHVQFTERVPSGLRYCRQRYLPSNDERTDIPLSISSMTCHLKNPYLITPVFSHLPRNSLVRFWTVHQEDRYLHWRRWVNRIYQLGERRGLGPRPGILYCTIRHLVLFCDRRLRCLTVLKSGAGCVKSAVERNPLILESFETRRKDILWQLSVWLTSVNNLSLLVYFYKILNFHHFLYLIYLRSVFLPLY